MLAGCAAAKEPYDSRPEVRRLQVAANQVRPLHSLLGRPKPGDWLDKHRERGQSFEEYLRGQPITARDERRIIYVQPIGEFTPAQEKIVATTADFLKVYFNLPVTVREALPASVVPESARRIHPNWGMAQWHTIYLLDQVLAPRLPDDAAAMIGFTATDLWPGEDWNFVFGQASMEKRVGVWSVYRNGDPAKGDAEFQLCLKRTMRTDTHETGHMFSLMHCTKYECNMCGSNNQGEADRRPLYLCPDCMAKVCWATKTDPLARYRNLASFCSSHGLKDEQAFYEKSVRLLEKR